MVHPEPGARSPGMQSCTRCCFHESRRATMSDLEAHAKAPVIAPVARPTLMGHLAICRVDHWFKNVFVLPGIVAAIGMDRAHVPPGLFQRIVVGLISVCLVASSNYVINEVLDAPSDRAHPIKYARPVPSGKVSIPLAYVQ